MQPSPTLSLPHSLPEDDPAPPIHRAIFIHAKEEGWHDRPGFNDYLRAAFPSLPAESQYSWEDLVHSIRPPPMTWTRFRKPFISLHASRR